MTEFTIGFYAAATARDGERAGLETILLELTRRRRRGRIAYQRGDNVYIVNRLSGWNRNRNFKGVFGKIRMKNLPHRADTDGHEEEIQLAENEGLVEKNHFIFTARNQLLIYQENFHGSYAGAFADFLSNVSGATVSFGHVLTSDAMDRLMRGGTEVRKLDLTIARPRNPAMYPGENFSQEVLQMMRESNAALLSIHMSANGPGQRGQRLHHRMKHAVRALVGSNQLKKAYAEIETDEGFQAVDLLADRVKSRRDVRMNGRYPIIDEMFNEMDNARRDVQDQLTAFFGHEGRQLD